MLPKIIKSAAFIGEVIRGKLVLDHMAAFQRAIRSLNGQRVVLRVERFADQRSLSQNAWYRGVAIPLLAEHCGYDKDEMHGALKFRFLREHTDSELPTVRSTAAILLKIAEERKLKK